MSRPSDRTEQARALKKVQQRVAAVGFFALITYAVIRVILQHPLWSPGWIALALAPTAVAFSWLW